MTLRNFLLIATVLAAAAVVTVTHTQAQGKPESVGYSDTPQIPGQKWKVHDIDRPHPRLVTPSNTPGGAPSDAIVLFDGKDLSKWVNKKGGKETPAAWKVQDGYFECLSNSGDLVTKEKFGDMQLHIEWASPVEVKGASQSRGNSGLLIMHRYEVQVLDSFDNNTYADGQAGAIYGWWPPLANAAKKPGEWQTYDVVFEAPKFEGGALTKKGYVTLFHNGVLLHNRQEIGGPMAHRVVKQYQPHAAEEPLALQDHQTSVRYRNIWVRKLMPYDSTPN